jgi:hypothetical protein
MFTNLLIIKMENVFGDENISHFGKIQIIDTKYFNKSR